MMYRGTEYKWNTVIDALNMLRLGEVHDAAVQISVEDDVPEEMEEVVVKHKDFHQWDEVDEFLKEMKCLRDELRKRGL